MTSQRRSESFFKICNVLKLCVPSTPMMFRLASTTVSRVGFALVVVACCLIAAEAQECSWCEGGACNSVCKKPIRDSIPTSIREAVLPFWLPTDGGVTSLSGGRSIYSQVIRYFLLLLLLRAYLIAMLINVLKKMLYLGSGCEIKLISWRWYKFPIPCIVVVLINRSGFRFAFCWNVNRCVSSSGKTCRRQCVQIYIGMYMCHSA